MNHSNERTNAIEQFTANVVVPIFYEISPECIDHIGTGTFFLFEEEYYIITARHLLDQKSGEFFAIPETPKGTTIKTLGSFEVYKPKDVNVDIAVLKLKDTSLIETIKREWRILTRENIKLASEQGVFLLCGHPSGVIKTTDNRFIGNFMSAYTQRLAEVPSLAERPVDSDLDLFFEYNKSATNIHQENIDTPHLGGLSGAIVWEYNEDDDQQFWTPEKTIKVVGIQSSFKHSCYFRAKNSKWLVHLLECAAKDSSSS